MALGERFGNAESATSWRFRKKAYLELFSNLEAIEMKCLLARVTNSESSPLNKIHFSYKLILTKAPPRLTSNKERE